MKIHFCQAHKELRETSNDTLVAMQHANIAQQVIEGIAHLIPPTPTEDISTLAPPPETPTVPPSATDTIMSPLTQTGTAFYSADPNMIIPSLMQQMGQMQNMMMTMQSSMCGSTTDSRGGGRGGRGRGCGRGRGGNRDGTYLPLTHYCWTHGWCRHNGTSCSAPADGHKTEATKTNRMGGSTRNLNV